jgi:tetratricopeptide (TPR) repeat protein
MDRPARFSETWQVWPDKNMNDSMTPDQTAGQTIIRPRQKEADRPLPRRSWSDNPNKLIVMLIAAITVFGASVAFLQVNASAVADRYNRQAQVGAVVALQHGIQGQLDYAHEYNLYRMYTELIGQSALSQLQGETAAADRFLAAADSLTRQSQLFPNAAYFDEASGAAYTFDYYMDKVYVPMLRATESQSADQLTGQAWSRKDNVYQAVITLTAVTLFLYGLALTLEGCLKWGFVALGTGNAGLILLWVLITMVRPIPRIDPATIDRYVAGNRYVQFAFNTEYWSDYASTQIWAETAISELDQAIAEERNYANAYSTRGDAYLLYGESLFLSEGDAAERDEALNLAVEDYRRAIELKPDEFYAYWNLGWASYLLGDYETALETFDSVTELVPRQEFGTSLNRANVLLGMGRTQEGLAEVQRAIDYAATNPLSSDALYFRQSLRNLDYLQRVRPQAGLAEMERMLKEAFVSLQYRHTSVAGQTAAQLSPLTFAVPIVSGDSIRYREGTVFPAETEQVVVLFDYQNMSGGEQVVLKVYHNGIEKPWLNQVISDWPAGASGQSDQFAIHEGLESTLTYLTPGDYHAEIYVEGNLLVEGDFTVQ